MDNIVDMVEIRRASPTKQQPDFMSYILPHMAAGQEKDAWLSAEELYLNSQLLVIAGSETTATLLSGAVFLLSRNAHVSHELTTLLRSTFESEEQITPAAASNISFLQRHSQ